ncbi:hypothetical protein AUEXF2481DRAFT_6446 [Aureobasidium subglaciale EXF-2481]|uniref:Uncharacterized protein n=1 Tax=Aureobasidium subglaciale (strain EXF-2481) TaxID=1043005 RepID=A0A074Y7W2_AURSE|nr:uncharacterized protein AUEXF2481DRAFT_6446 [Aureobasidium subglaciale EXF-2481]KAI5208852.1 hypothetical protein E4T38_02706 [Aureobasidium subglaciale]KAI5227667.1 hypothetical protein E4T40_02469 [Aureobasidium subglaciale]KAI5231034.1 hypothetical protein E4T41_02705 [Aureobasidium subglaciale]KAI5265143.1 hypothetical protein E4T46_02483 [Aureobasidium subglaciale]KEQ93873.1 hypothetical protein AUEXF2481DRAFT_6446 [Aureobasidium subglaciale EXF-2481]
MPMPSRRQYTQDETGEDELEQYRSDGESPNIDLAEHERHIHTRNDKKLSPVKAKNVSWQSEATVPQNSRRLVDAEGEAVGETIEGELEDEEEAMRRDRDASQQLQEEASKARNPRTQASRSGSSSGSSTSKVDSHRASSTARSTSRVDPGRVFDKNISPVQEEFQHPNVPTARSTEADPAPLRTREDELVSYKDVGEYTGTSDPTPLASLTPRERKDNELDATVMCKLDALRSHINEFCAKHFEHQADPRTPTQWRTWAGAKGQGKLELLDITRLVADGGGGPDTWLTVIRDKTCRYGLSFAIINRVLVRHVFNSLLFGAPQDLQDELDKNEKQEEGRDGFYRAEQRAQYITSYEIQHRVNLNTSSVRKHDVFKMALQIAELLKPLFELRRSTEHDPHGEVVKGLYTIVDRAAELATLMRKSGNTVLYQFGQVFKEQAIERKTTGVLNMRELEEEFARERRGDLVLIRIVCGDHLLAYRKGGGVMAQRLLEKEGSEQDTSIAPELRHLPRNVYRGRVITADDGYRSKFLAKALVIGRLEQADGGRAVDLLDALKDEACVLQ